MARYKNGEVPASLLRRRGAIRLTAGTWAKWDALVADVKARFGVTLTITQGSGVTSGSGGYRDFAMQKAVKDKYRRLGRPQQAATEGTSSHGGEYKGRDALAIDVNNYWAIPQRELFAAARRAGFTPGVFDGKGGRPLEPWHLIDYDPYRNVAPAGITPNLPEGKTMSDVKQIHWVKENGQIGGRALLIPGTAWALPFTESGSTYANRAATQFGTGSSVEYTKSMFGAFLRAAERCAPTSVRVEIVDAE